jgi:hypothetical protein
LLDEARRELAAVGQAELFNTSKYEKSREKWVAWLPASSTTRSAGALKGRSGSQLDADKKRK